MKIGGIGSNDDNPFLKKGLMMIRKDFTGLNPKMQTGRRESTVQKRREKPKKLKLRATKKVPQARMKTRMQNLTRVSSQMKMTFKKLTCKNLMTILNINFIIIYLLDIAITFS